MTATEMHSKIGTLATIDVKGLHFGVKVIDVRQRYGRLQYLVRPLSGTGESWVEVVQFNAF